jgi:hypothetical protein
MVGRCFDCPGNEGKQNMRWSAGAEDVAKTDVSWARLSPLYSTSSELMLNICLFQTKSSSKLPVTRVRVEKSRGFEI